MKRATTQSFLNETISAHVIKNWPVKKTAITWKSLEEEGLVMPLIVASNSLTTIEHC